MSYLQQCINERYCILYSCWETAGIHCSYIPPSSSTGTTPGICEGMRIFHSLGVQHQTPSLKAVCGNEMVGGGVTWNRLQVSLINDTPFTSGPPVIEVYRNRPFLTIIHIILVCTQLQKCRYLICTHI